MGYSQANVVVLKKKRAPNRLAEGSSTSFSEGTSDDEEVFNNAVSSSSKP